MADFSPGVYFPAGYFPDSYFGADDSPPGTMRTALMGSASVSAILSSAGGASAAYLSASLSGSGTMSGSHSARLTGEAPTSVYDARAWLSVRADPTQLAFRAHILSAGHLTGGLSAFGAPSHVAAGAGRVRATLGGNIGGRAAVAGGGRVGALLTGIFDYVTDDNDFWLLAA